MIRRTFKGVLCFAGLDSVNVRLGEEIFDEKNAGNGRVVVIDGQIGQSECFEGWSKSLKVRGKNFKR